MRGGRLARALLGFVGSGVAAVTLMACYGGPGMHMQHAPPTQCLEGGVDGDGDGQCTPADCNDADGTISPAMAEASDADGIDQNCDGADGLAEPVPVTPDPDGDVPDDGDGDGDVPDDGDGEPAEPDE